MKAPRWNGKACEVGPYARLVVAGLYPVTNTTLASVIPGYGAYTKNNGTVTGLDPTMISADVAVGLLQSGLAGLQIGAAAPITDVSALSRSAIVAAYTDPAAVIVGTVTNWVIGLRGGLSTMDRLRARAIEGLVLVQAMIGGLDKSGAAIAFTGATIAGTTIPAGWINKLAALTGSPTLDFAGSTWRNRAIPTGTAPGLGCS